MTSNASIAVLLVDDNPAQRYATARMLGAAGFVVREAASGNEALQGVQTSVPDIVLLDVNLPDMDGLEVCRRLKADPAIAGIPVVHISASELEPQHKVAGLESGADAYLTHPISGRELVSHIQAVLRVRQAEQERERAVREAAVRLQQAYRAGRMWSWALNPSDGMVRRSAEALNAEIDFGEVQEETIEEWLERMHPDDREAARSGIQRMFECGGDYEHEFRQRWADGQYHWIYVRGQVVEGNGGRVLCGVAMDTTERQRLEEAQLRLSALVESSDDAIVGKTLDGMVTSWNRGAEELYGYSAEEMIGRSIARLAAPDHADDIRVILERLRRGERVQSYDTVRRRKDGSLVEVSLKVSPILDRAGRVVGASSIARDIGERKRIGQALRESEARFRSIYEQAAVGIEQVAMDGRLLLVNPALCRMLDYTKEELQRRTCGDITHPDDRGGETALLEEMLWGERDSFEVEKRYLKRDGTPVWVHLNSSLVRDTGGTPLYRISIVQDISERNVAEAALREEQVKLRTLTENIPQLVWSCDQLGQCDYVSNRWLEYTGTGLEDNLGSGWLKLVHSEDREHTQAAWAKAVAEATSFEMEYRLRNAAGEYEWHLARGITFAGTSGGRWFGTCTNIEEMKRTQAALMRSEKLASVGRMAATIAHEINNPLEAIMNAVYLAWSDPQLPTSARAYLDIAEQELGRVAHMTRQTLGFYRETGRPVAVDLADLVREVLEMFGPRLKTRGVQAESRLAPARVQASPGELRQIVSNLVSNSLDALGPGGCLRVSVRRDGCSGSALLTIADSGSGIAPEHRKRIFEPFFTTKEAVGTGLGLWVTHELVKRYGGTIRMRSREGKGTVFRICFGTEESGDRVN